MEEEVDEEIEEDEEGERKDEVVVNRINGLEASGRSMLTART